MRWWVPKCGRRRRLAFQSREAPPTLSLLLLLLLLLMSSEAGGDGGDGGDGVNRLVFGSYGLHKNGMTMRAQRRSRELPSVTAKAPGDGAALVACDSFFCRR